MALDKCLPRRKYLELVEIPHNSEVSLDLCYDPQWLAILKSTNNLLSVSSSLTVKLINVKFITCLALGPQLLIAGTSVQQKKK